MSAYTPVGPQVVVWLALAALAVLVLGLGLRRGSQAVARPLSWLLVPAAVGFAQHASASEPPGVRMLAICALLLYAMKAVVGVHAGGSRLGGLQWLAFAAAWPGMQPRPFRRLGSPRLAGAGRLIRGGLLRFAAGAALLAGARAVFVATASRAVATPLVLAGLSLAFHFGSFNLVAGLWRLAGVDVGPLFRAPLLSRSLTEFWGKRWNLAFSVMTGICVYKPVAARAGRVAGLLAAFVVSGVFHELAISLPVGAGYGGPLGYFLLHGLLVVAEGRWPLRGRVWTLFWVIVPLPLLFHRPFLEGVIWPLLGPRP